MKYIKKFHEGFASKLVGAAALATGLGGANTAFSQTKEPVKTEITDDWGKFTPEVKAEVNKIINTVGSTSIIGAPIYKGYDIEEELGDEYLSQSKIPGIIIIKDKEHTCCNGLQLSDVIYIYSGYCAGNPPDSQLVKKFDIKENTYIPSSDLPERFTIFRNGGTGYKFHKISKDNGINNRTR